jgi:Ca-activated chloride channel family protein
MLFFSKRQALQDGDSASHPVASRGSMLAICAAIGILFGSSATAEIANPSSPNCYQDAMLVFDASGSMEEWGSSRYTTRIDDVRKALAVSLPHVTPNRRLGLISYGPGSLGGCNNITLNLKPEFDAGPKIMAEVNGIDPAGRTPLTSAVEQAADVLDYRHKAALVVLLTDGSETCGRQPCELAKTLKATGKAITVHVIGYRMQDLISQREQGVTDMKCLAAQTGGRFIGAGSTDELVDALNKTLGCSLLSDRAPLNDARRSRLLAVDGMPILLDHR